MEIGNFLEENMKKTLITLLLGVIMGSVTFAETAVVYFSCTGNTKRLAQTASSALNADLIEIVPEVLYTQADLNWHDSKSRSSIESNDSKIAPCN